MIGLKIKRMDYREPAASALRRKRLETEVRMSLHVGTAHQLASGNHVNSGTCECDTPRIKSLPSLASASN
jgi:hypothetical protein